MLKVALPNKGSLSEESVDLFRKAGYRCRRSGRELMVVDADNEIDFFYLRPRDIAVYVGNGVVDLGVTGRDLAIDSGTEAKEITALGFGASSFYYAIPENEQLTPDMLGGRRIATSYPLLVRRDLDRRNLEAEVVRLDGAVEISIRLGVADTIADVVESGRTLREAGLKTIGEPILESEAIVVARSEELAQKPKVSTILDRLKGIVVAREYVMIEYDIPKTKLNKACAITPGIESPTIAPLSEEGWTAVKSMAKNKGINGVMDALASIGAKGIIVTEIKSCRI